MEPSQCTRCSLTVKDDLRRGRGRFRAAGSLNGNKNGVVKGKEGCEEDCFEELQIPWYPQANEGVGFPVFY